MLLQAVCWKLLIETKNRTLNCYSFTIDYWGALQWVDFFNGVRLQWVAVQMGCNCSKNGLSDTNIGYLDNEVPITIGCMIQ